MNGRAIHDKNYRRLRSTLIEVGLIVGLMVSASGIQGQVPQGGEPQGSLAILWPADSIILETASLIVLAQEKLEAVWPGFWVVGSAFTLFDSESAFLVSSSAPAAPFRPVDVPNGFPELSGILYGSRELPAGVSTSSGSPFGFNFRFQSGDVLAPSIRARDGVADAINSLFHEAFHGFQIRATAMLRFRQQDFWLDSTWSIDPGYTAATELERRLLSQALSAPPDLLTHVLEDYIAVRAHRTAMLTPEFATSERHQETMEGTATYVGDLSAAAAKGWDRATVVDSLKARLDEPIDLWAWIGDLDQLGRMRWYHRLRLYQSGAALSVLLDRLDPDWKSRVGEGSTLYDELLGQFSVLDPAERATKVLQRFGYDELLIWAESVLSDDGGW